MVERIATWLESDVVTAVCATACPVCLAVSVAEQETGYTFSMPWGVVTWGKRFGI